MKARDGYDLLLTALFCAYLLAVRRRGRGFGPKIPEGDLLVPVLSLLGSTGRLSGRPVSCRDGRRSARSRPSGWGVFTTEPRPARQ